MKGIVAAGKGIAMGVARIVRNVEYVAPDAYIADVEKEIERFYDSRLKASERLKKVIEDNRAKGNQVDILEAQEMLLMDIEAGEQICTIIRQEKRSAEYAVEQVMTAYAETFLAMGEDDYFRARFQDCLDIKRMLIQELQGIESVDFNTFEKGTVLVTDDLLPSQLLTIDKEIITGIVMASGSETSHITILLRTAEMPSVVGFEKAMDCIKDGETVIVDGFAGECILSPDEEVQRSYRLRMKGYDMEKKELEKYAGEKIYSKSGKHVKIMANIGSLEDVPYALKNGAEGVGLFRTEFLFTTKDYWPSEEEQRQAYQYVSDQFEGNPVIIRTMDIGGDKPLPYYKHAKESNPFLGLRGIRLCLEEKGQFRTQLRALLRANTRGNIQIMLPMISHLEEVQQVKAMLEEIKEDLRKERLPFNEDTQLGIMIEVPAAALCADILAKEVDFFSLGTNDLTQYTMATDRLNERVNHLYDPMNPAVIRLMENVIREAKAHHIEVGICGEAGRNPQLVHLLVDLEIDEISMSSDNILAVKKEYLSGK